MIAAAPIQAAEPTSEELISKARSWALESGLTEPIAISSPERVAFPRFGHGYVVQISEQNSPERVKKTRIATARFNDRGERRMWTIDGQVVL